MNELVKVRNLFIEGSEQKEQKDGFFIEMWLGCSRSLQYFAPNKKEAFKNGLDFTLTLLNTRSTLRSEAVMVLSQMERLINWFKEVAVRRNLVEHAIKKEFFQLMGATKLHGCYRIYAGKTYGRLFWLLMAISTGVIFIIVLAELTKQYKAENVSTQVEIVYDYADGPSITICSHNPVRRNYIEELKRTTTFSDELLMYLLHIFLRPEGLVKMNVMESLRDGERLLQDYMLAYKNFTVESFVKEASFKCEEAFVQCAFEGIMFDCCNEKYSTAVITDLGYCFQFDWNKLSKDFSLSYHFGSVHGFQVMLDYQSYNEVYLVNYTGSRIRQPFLDNFETGFRLYVHDKNTVSYVNSEVLVVSPNTKLSTGLKPIKYQFLERSKGGTCCNTWPSTLHHNSTYSSSACKMTCLARHFYMNCGCVPLQYNILKGEIFSLKGRLCSPKEVFDCINNFKEIASTVRNVTYSPLCQNCAPECELFIYFTQNFIIHNILTSLGEYMKSLKQQYKLSYVRSISIMPRFFTNSWMLLYVKQHLQNKLMTYGLVKEQSGNCKIGSDMGLFYGASVISLFELILLLFKTIWALASPSRTVYLKEKANQEMERKLRIEEIINEYSILDKMVTEIVERPQRKLDHVMSLTLTPEQASAILEAETFVDSIYVPLRRDKLLSAVGDINGK
ncbi:Amiloride-sensitive sodium channel [Onchocerca flexuosa]|nr:Amiloride-sensitive sodium channel [Onchocerca flexuosa]